jgi:phosphohistidine phosphatase
MLIHLFRHGDAPFNASCGERSLSIQGKIETCQIVEQHIDELSQLQLIVCSPVLRARQTLEILTESLNYSGQLLFEDVLRSEGSVSRVEHYVDTLVSSLKVEHLLLLSHQPLIGEL